MTYYIVSYKNNFGEWVLYKKPGVGSILHTEVGVEDGQEVSKVVKDTLKDFLGYIPSNYKWRKKRKEPLEREGFKNKYVVRFTAEKNGKVLKDWEFGCLWSGYLVCEDTYPKALAKAIRELKPIFGDTLKITKITLFSWEDRNENGTSV